MMDVSQANSSMNSVNDDSLCSTNTTAKQQPQNSAKKSQTNNAEAFYKDLYQFHENKGYFI